MLALMWGCRKCDKYGLFSARKRTLVRGILKRAASLHREASPKYEYKAKDLVVCSEFQAHCAGWTD